VAATKSVDDLHAQIAYLRDLEDIRAVKWRYCHFSDKGWRGAGADHDAWLNLFTEDVIYDTQGNTPTMQGRGELSRWHNELVGTRLLSFHLLGSGAIEVTGDTALGRWHGLTPLTDKNRSVAFWSAGRFDDSFLRTSEGWKIQKVTFYPAFVTPYSGGGWVDAVAGLNL
jgi:hypothetical protein